MSKLIYEESLPGYKFQIFDDKPEFDLLDVSQVHGAVILEDNGESLSKLEADGLMSSKFNLPLAIKTADCLPIAAIGKKGAALLHAGWRGVHQKIVQNSKLAQIDPEYFYIGPHIQFGDFEVQENFKENFPGSHHFKEEGDKIFFNLAAEVSDQILQVYPKAKIQVCALSTVGDDRFHSYRETKTSGRNWNILSLSL